MDAQSVPNASSGQNKGYDAGKKVSGIKRHIMVDTNGLVHGIYITPANETDRVGALQLLEKQKKNLPLLEKVLADGGYRGTSFADAVQECIGTVTKIVKRDELHTFVVLPKRWRVERTFAWFEKCRRLWRNCERLVESSKAMTQIAFMRILLKRL